MHEVFPLRRNLLVLLRHIVAEPINVILEDEVVDLARVARLRTRDPVAVLEAGALQVHKVLLMLLEFTIESIDHELLTFTDIVLIENAATLGAEEDNVAICCIRYNNRLPVRVLQLLVVVLAERLVARLQVIRIHLLIRHQLKHLARLLRGEELRVRLIRADRHAIDAALEHVEELFLAQLACDTWDLFNVVLEEIFWAEGWEALHQALEQLDEELSVRFERLEVLEVAWSLWDRVVELRLVAVRREHHRQTHRGLLVVDQVEQRWVLIVLQIVELAASFHCHDVVLVFRRHDRTNGTLLWDARTYRLLVRLASGVLGDLRKLELLLGTRVIALTVIVLLSREPRHLVLFLELLHRLVAFVVEKDTLADELFSLAHVVLVPHDVVDLLHLDEVDLAEGFLARLTPQAQARLVAENDLKVVQAPRHELPRQALVLAPADLAHEAVVEHVLVVRRQPDVVLLLLHPAEDVKRVRRFEGNRLGHGDTQVDEAALVGLVDRVHL